jgi:hypothetical protein
MALITFNGGPDVGWGASAAAAAELEGEDWKGVAAEVSFQLNLSALLFSIGGRKEEGR